MGHDLFSDGSLQGLAAPAGAAKLRAIVNSRAGLHVQYLYSSNHHSNYAWRAGPLHDASLDSLLHVYNIFKSTISVCTNYRRAGSRPFFKNGVSVLYLS